MSEPLFIEKPKKTAKDEKRPISEAQRKHLETMREKSLMKRRENAKLKQEGEHQPKPPTAAPPIIPSSTPLQAPPSVPKINREEMMNNKLNELQKNIEDNIKNYFNAHLAKFQAPKPPQQNIQAVMERKVEAPKPIPSPQPAPKQIQPIATPPPTNQPQAAKPFYFNAPYKRPIV